MNKKLGGNFILSPKVGDDDPIAILIDNTHFENGLQWLAHKNKFLILTWTQSVGVFGMVSYRCLYGLEAEGLAEDAAALEVKSPRDAG
jgi:hypothetical protein